MKTRTAIYIMLAMSVLAGCSKEKARQMPPAPVTTAQVALQAQPLALNVVGLVEPIESVAVKPQAGGVITGVHFTEGGDVRAGQLLFRIDPRPYHAALHAAEAQLARDSSQAVYTAMQAQRYAGLSEKDSSPASSMSRRVPRRRCSRPPSRWTRPRSSRPASI